MTISLDQADERGAETRFADLARRLGARPEPPLLGDEAFISTDGSTLVVRGGSRVLEVDLSGSPTELGQPPQPRALVARAVAGTIVGCDDPPCPKGALRFEDEGDE